MGIQDLGPGLGPAVFEGTGLPFSSESIAIGLQRPKV
jgi:hypothetical protein